MISSFFNFKFFVFLYIWLVPTRMYLSSHFGFPQCTVVVVHAQLSHPIAHDAHGPSSSDSKFLSRSASKDAAPVPLTLDEVPLDSHLQCAVDLELKWMAEVSSSVYASPVIADLRGDGARQVVVPSFVHYLEAVEGRSGASAHVPGGGWPAYHKASVHASPVLMDADGDGDDEVVLATYEGDIVVHRRDGTTMHHLRAKLPPLRVRRDWYVGINPDPVDHSHPDVGAADEFEARAAAERGGDAVDAFFGSTTEPVKPPGMQTTTELTTMATATTTTAAPTTTTQATTATTTATTTSAPTTAAAAAETTRRRSRRRQLRRRQLLQELDPAGGALSDDALNSFHVFDEDGDVEELQQQEDGGYVDESNYEDEDDWMGDADHRAWNEYEDPKISDEDIDEKQDGYDGYREEEYEDDFDHHDHHAYGDHHPDYEAYDDDEWMHHLGGAVGGVHGDFDPRTHVLVDAHVLCSPTAADVDGDGRDELIIGVSYFFDRESYDDPEKAARLRKTYEGDAAGGAGPLDLSKYIAGGIVAYDFETRQVLWSQHLDLTTDDTRFRAYVYSTPSVLDVNRDGRMEVFLGTSVGFVYGFTSDGGVLPGWPIQMGDVQGQVLVSDVDDDGHGEIVAADANGNIACFDFLAHEKWERHLGSLASQGPVAADIDGDGHTEVAIGLSSGEIYVFRGKDGHDVGWTPEGQRRRSAAQAQRRARGEASAEDLRDGPFPFATRGKVMAPLALIDIAGGKRHQGMGPAEAAAAASAAMDVGGVAIPPPPMRDPLAIAALSFDGYLYVIDGRDGCASVLDLGETGYAGVLYDDVDGDGNMELVVATMNGNIYAVQVGIVHYKPGMAHAAIKPNQAHGRDWFGAFATTASRHQNAVGGEEFTVSFNIVDQRPKAFEPPSTVGEKPRSLRGPYSVTVELQGTHLDAPWINGADERMLVKETYASPGMYHVKMLTPQRVVKSGARVVITIVDELGEKHTDEYPITFHTQGTRLLKWMASLPFLMLCFVAAVIGVESGREDRDVLAR